MHMFLAVLRNAITHDLIDSVTFVAKDQSSARSIAKREFRERVGASPELLDLRIIRMGEHIVPHVVTRFQKKLEEEARHDGVR
jgi:hypothetical protein